MKPIKLFFASSLSYLDIPFELLSEIKYKLVSFGYPEQFPMWLKEKKECGIGGKEEIIIDSGAFSAWNNNRKIDIDAYIDYCFQAIEEGEKQGFKVHVVNLDVIPGKVGQSASLRLPSKENKKIINYASEQGLKNLQYMQEKGLKPIHVFHQGEDFLWLEEMCKLVDYIGVSPANDLGFFVKKQWIEFVFNYLHSKNLSHIKTHGFAVWSVRIIKDLPFTSCDAATWRILAGMGGIYLPIGGFLNPDYSKSPQVVHVSEGKKSIKGQGHFTEHRLHLLEQAGYTFEDLQNLSVRTCINIRYVLGLQRWLNKYKKQVIFQPKQTGFFDCLLY